MLYIFFVVIIPCYHYKDVCVFQDNHSCRGVVRENKKCFLNRTCSPGWHCPEKPNDNDSDREPSEFIEYTYCVRNPTTQELTTPTGQTIGGSSENQTGIMNSLTTYSMN